MTTKTTLKKLPMWTTSTPTTLIGQMQQVGIGVISARRLLSSSWTWLAPPHPFVKGDNTHMKLYGFVMGFDGNDGGDASVDVSLGLMMVAQLVTLALPHSTILDEIYTEVVPAVWGLVVAL